MDGMHRCDVGLMRLTNAGSVRRTERW